MLMYVQLHSTNILAFVCPRRDLGREVPWLQPYIVQVISSDLSALYPSRFTFLCFWRGSFLTAGRKTPTGCEVPPIGTLSLALSSKHRQPVGERTEKELDFKTCTAAGATAVHLHAPNPSQQSPVLPKFAFFVFVVFCQYPSYNGGTANR